jgi:hypothetical protein
MLLSDRNNKRIVEIVCEISKPVRSWHQSQNQFCRNVDNIEKWVPDQVCGDWIQHLHDIIGQFTSHATLSRCGFCLPRTGAALGEDLNMLVLVDDDFVEVFGDYAFMLSRTGCGGVCGWCPGTPRSCSQFSSLAPSATRW